MPKVEEEASIKTDKLQKQLDEIIEEKNKHDTRILGLTPDDPNYADERRKFDEITRQERGINGQLTSIKNYVDYNQLEPISIEHALSWMPKALSASDREGMLKCVNSNLIAYNPNIQACGKKGQPILRLSAADCDYSGGYRRQVINNEISIVSARWDMLPENIKHMSFKEIYNLASSLQYSGKDIEFQKANSTYIDDQDEYDRAEEIYLRGKLTPSRFKTGKMYYSDDKSWRCFIAPKDDPRVLYAGGNFADRGHCCQSYDDVGSDCAVDSVTNPDSGCVIFERNMAKDKDEPCWEMLGCVFITAYCFVFILSLMSQNRLYHHIQFLLYGDILLPYL